ncbi:patronin isoform X20 [Glossina fuscipes]|uniref:Patronin isoform X20 n=1 Tax=Glossina fuscipes TaxID=7396 RepID=A0A9C5ZBG7_9MUSC|nr:patronin isoform X20 [Glossina fuscipes]
MDETLEIRQARHRASVKWLLSKAYNNRVPDNLKEPFYRDHENQERLKPKIIVDLGNATLYCQTLSNLYSDPNYQSLNHWSILQTLARKGVPVNESKDMPLTETVLIQTNPLRIMAHMAVIESLMLLFAKEIASGDRVNNAIKRISGSNYQSPAGANTEQTLLSWVSYTCSALKKRVERDISTGVTDEQGKRLQTPDIPPVRDFQDLCDGICLALLLSYYCPKAVQWTDVRINYLPAVEDSIHNVLIVSNFSERHLPYNVFHMLPEDITYMRGSMKLNLLVLLADLFNLFEIHPANCVNYPGMDSLEVIAKQNAGANEHGFYHRRGLTMPTVTPIPDLRSDLDQPTGSPTTRPQFQVTYTNSSSGFIHKPVPQTIQQQQQPPPQPQISSQQLQQSDYHINVENTHYDNEAFIVHKSRGITTLSSMHMQQQQQQQQQDPLMPARLRQAKEKNNHETKADERGDNVPAGRPSNWDQNRRPSYAGRRSRRNSSSEDSQLTIENFGGSQDQLNAIDRFERERDRERKLSNTTIEPVAAVRSSIIDARGTLQLGYDTDSGSEKQDHDTEKQQQQQQEQQQTLKRQPSYDNVSLAGNSQSRTSMTSTNNNQTQKHSNSPDITDEPPRDPNATLTRKSSNASMHMKSSNWQNNQNDLFDDDTRSLDSAYKLSNMRMKLEEKRRRIETALMRYQEKMSQDDLEGDYMKWETMSNDSKRTSDIDPNELDKYQQQNFGSQQHLADPYSPRPLSHQANYGSSPHLPQAFNNSGLNPYSRPPSRDPYQQQQMPPAMPLQFINDAGQYMYAQQQPVPQYNAIPMHYNVSADNNAVPYNNSNHTYIGGPPTYSNQTHQQQQQQQQQQPHPTYIPRQSVYDDYIPPQSMMVREPNMSPQPNNYYVHEQQPPPLSQPQLQSGSQQYSNQRRTWAQSSFDHSQMIDVNAWQTPRKSQPPPSQRSDDGSSAWGSPQMDSNMQHQQQRSSIQQNGDSQTYPIHSSPIHSQRVPAGGGVNNVQRQHSMTNLRENIRSPNVATPKASSAPTPPDDVMAPQSICFIGDEDDVDELDRSLLEKMQNTGLSEYSFPIHHNQQHQQQQCFERNNSAEDYNEMMPQKLNITSGNLTYRIPSPQRPHLHANSFQDPRASDRNTNEKGFYISFDDDQPKRPKPPLRAKRSPKKEKSMDSVDHQVSPKVDINSFYEDGIGVIVEPKLRPKIYNHRNAEINATGSQKLNLNNNSGKATYNKYTDSPIQLSQVMAMGNNDNKNEHAKLINNSHNNHNIDCSQLQTPPPTPKQAITASPTLQRKSSPVITRQQLADSKSQALVIGTDVSSLDPESVDEMERRKEKIMLMSLQRRQQQEEAKERKEQEAARKRELEREKEEEKQRKKEEQMARRAAILEQHRLKKALEEAEREGKTLDHRSDLMHKPVSQTTVTRTRTQKSTRPRPKTIHVDDGSVDISEASSISSRGKKGSSSNITEPNVVERGRTLSRISVAKGSSLNFRGRKSNSLMNLCGPKLYKQPAAKSNRGIILNAVEYCVFPGAVNREAKQKVLEKIARSEAKHFLILFRDAGCQFRALYSYTPETEQVFKLYGTGPSQVDEVMFDKFFKYNSGGKCFSQVHTKHLTVTIDAFTIHNSLWQGKKVNLPSKKDMALVI